MSNQNYLIRVQQGELPPYGSNFEYFKAITINQTKVNGTGIHENFPVLISILDSDLHDEVQANGNDIAFAIGLEWLDHEIEYFNQSYSDTEAQLIAWVRVPSLHTSVDTIITMFFGNSTMGPCENPSGVWDNDYKGVWHLSEDPTGTLYDSTANNNDGTGHYLESNDLVSAKIDGGIDFEGGGSNEYIDCGSASSLDITQDLTVEFWINIDSDAPSEIWPTLVGKGDENYDGWRVYQSESSHTIEFGYYDTEDSPHWILGLSAPTLDTWHHVVVSYNYSGTNADMYLDGGDEIYSTTTEINEINSNSLSLYIADEMFDGYFDGKIDEVRISDIARSADWIATEYNNQHDPDSFYAIGDLSQTTDKTAPTYSNLIKSADPLELYFTEIITINVTDPAGINQVLIEFEGSNHPMTNIGGDTWQYDDWIPTSTGTHNYTIWMEDNYNNWNSTSDKILVTPDVTAPTYANLIESADILQLKQNETITINVYDSPGAGVNTTILEYELSDHTLTNHTMNFMGGNTWSWSNWKPKLEGFYNYTIYMKDHCNNWNITTGNITVVSTNAPIIGNVSETPDPLELGNNITIHADIYDNETSVSVVLINLDGVNYTMNNITGNTYEFNWTKNSTGQVIYTIYANDTGDNWNQITTYFFIEDTTKPTFMNLTESQDPVELGTSLNITIDVNDLAGISQVLFEFESSNHPMTNIGGKKWEYYTWTPPLSIGNYSYTIWAKDNNNNWNFTTSSILVRDTIAPTYSNLVETAQSGGSVDPLEFGDTLFITIYVTDLAGINQTKIEYELTNHTMNFMAGDTWYDNSWRPINRGNNTYKIYIQDKSGNWNFTTDWIMVNDTTAPSDPIFAIVPSGEVTGHLTFDWIDGDDPSGIDYYNLIISTNNNPNITTDHILNITTVSSYYKLTNSLPLGTYFYFLSQVDNVGLSSEYTSGTFTVISPPSPSDDDNSPSSPPDDDSNLIFLLIIIFLVTLASSVVAILIVKRKSQAALHLPKKKILFKIILSHINQISSSEQLFKKDKFIQKLEYKKIEEITLQLATKSKLELEQTLDEIQIMADEQFSEGAYFKALKKYKIIENILARLGRNEEALIYSDVIIEINKNIELREKTLELLEQEMSISDFMRIFELFYVLIEISKKINDFDAIENFQSELIEIFHEKNKSTAEIELKKSILEDNANILYSKQEFEKAAEYYQQCERFSHFLFLLGKEKEFSNIQQFRSKKNDCLKKIKKQR